MKQLFARTYRLGWIVIVLTLAFMPFALSSERAVAQDTKTVDYDKLVSGQISDTNLTDTWTLTAPGKDVLSIIVDRQDGTLVPKVELRDSQNQVLASADHDATAAHAMIASLQLPAAGTYTIVVSRYKAKDGKTNGTYNLQVPLLGAGPDRPDMYPVGQTITDLNGIRSGVLTNKVWGVVYGFATLPQSHVLITVTRTDGNLLPTLSLETAQGVVIQRAPTSPDGTAATMDVIAPSADYLYIRIARTDNEKGLTTGAYKLVVKTLGRSVNLKDVNSYGGQYARVGEPNHCLIEASNWFNAYAIRVPTQETSFMISVKRTKGTFIPALKLLTENGDELVSVDHDDTFAAATISEFDPPTPGTYLIIVLREGGALGATEGEYELDVMPLKQ